MIDVCALLASVVVQMTNGVSFADAFGQVASARARDAKADIELAATSCLCELTERSDRSGSKPMSIPDFTRGNWRNVKPWGIVNVDLKRMGLK